MQKNPVRIGLIGLGKMGQNHLRVLAMLKSVELVFIHDANLESARRLGETYSVPVAENLDQVLDQVDAVVIATPTVTHAEYVRKVATNVKNIFVEKPLADTLQEAEALHAFVQQHALNVQVGFIERFNPAIQQLKKVLDKSKQIISVDFTRTNKLSARITDVDVVTDLMIHDIDLALYINGPVCTVSAHGVKEGQMIDFASALLTHTNGRFSRIQASRITEKKVRSVQATCMDMYVDCELMRKEIVINRQSEIRQQSGEPYTISALEETVEVRPQEALLIELQTFVARCQGEAVSLPDALAGLEAMQICDQIQKAVLQ
ncbi:Gfo/Idh/MocA family oxidoreductase [Andreprevotia chitinilytica]|uniref:Gfo/Idh/MocA family oxidoreductase n=1 Tax=Andreprevotia chitinilytica TaxID=396808 RepID=UPI00054F208A|nr:Gfo/Idh/MocA family oxidoreductase [Andreprevotia chitinilytica]